MSLFKSSLSKKRSSFGKMFDSFPLFSFENSFPAFPVIEDDVFDVFKTDFFKDSAFNVEEKDLEKHKVSEEVIETEDSTTTTSKYSVDGVTITKRTYTKKSSVANDAENSDAPLENESVTADKLSGVEQKETSTVENVVDIESKLKDLENQFLELRKLLSK